MGNVVRTHVIAINPIVRADVASALRHCPEILVSSIADRDPGRVAVVIAHTVEDATALFRMTYRHCPPRPIMLVGTVVGSAACVPTGNADGCTVFQYSDVTPGVLSAAVRLVGQGESPAPQKLSAKQLGARPMESRCSERELRVLQLIARGYSNAEIARALAYSEHTVKNIIYDLLCRLQLRNRVHAAAYAVWSGVA